MWDTTIEIESLAVQLGQWRSSTTFICQPFYLESDQKLLEAILSKSLMEATPRLQQTLIRTFAYHFPVRYIPGITNQLADCLSQLGG